MSHYAQRLSLPYAGLSGRSPHQIVTIQPHHPNIEQVLDAPDPLYMVAWETNPPRITASGPEAIGVATIAAAVTGTIGLVWLGKIAIDHYAASQQRQASRRSKH